MKSCSLILCLLLFGANANAFDKLHCQAELKDWIVTLTDSTRTAVLTPYNLNTTLTELQSQKLIVMGANAETIVTVFPWNSLYVRIPQQTKKNYEVRSTETSSGFWVEIADKESKVRRSLNCRFTF